MVICCIFVETGKKKYNRFSVPLGRFAIFKIKKNLLILSLSNPEKGMASLMRPTKIVVSKS